ncbi:hypothetical protein [Chryseobacterium sp. MMS23-Vi53]|uniref:hypothetical protein n=1 Tax=Chryseobacterium sp. MMS23-Vi53 TaxID=3386644 RepID=UPI0039EA9B6D
MKTLILISLMSIAFGCRSKQKITTDHKKYTKETEKVKVDSSGFQSSKAIQNESTDASLQEEKNEISGNISIKGHSDLVNPFIFHNIVGKDTIQSISILGNAEYLISNRYAKADNKKSEIVKKESIQIVQDSIQKDFSKEQIKEVSSAISEETQKIKVNGFELAAWIFITIIGITLILIFFTYKYLKK